MASHSDRHKNTHDFLVRKPTTSYSGLLNTEPIAFSLPCHKTEAQRNGERLVRILILQKRYNERHDAYVANFQSFLSQRVPTDEKAWIQRERGTYKDPIKD